MKPLQELSLLQRIALAVGILVFVILVLMFISWLTNADAQSNDNLYGDIAFDPKLVMLDKQALNEAYEEQIKHLFSIWVKGQAKGTAEITNGIRIARRAYGIANNQIEKREGTKP
jgi:hypothetical protein